MRVSVKELRALVKQSITEATKSKRWTAFMYTESGGVGGYGQNMIIGFVNAADKEAASKRAAKLFGTLYSGNYGWVEETTPEHEEEFKLRNPTGFE